MDLLNNKNEINNHTQNKSALTIIHFNDVYDVASQNREPVGGAARFCTAIKKFSPLNPVVIFAGDCFAPSLLSTFTKGEHMVPVLNSVKTAAAVYGNHDFDFGVDVLEGLVKQTNFPWMMSNVIDNETGEPLGDGKISIVLENQGKKIGLMGLVEWEWLETLSTIDPDAVTFRDYVDVGNELAQKLRNEGCDLIIAVTHMRFPNDMRLAENAKAIDLVLGAHDHVYDVKYVNGIPVLKSGTDFRDFSVITVTWNDEKDEKCRPQFKIDRISVTSDYPEDADLKKELAIYSEMMDTKLDDLLGEFHVDLDGRFTAVRTGETNLGNFMCDIMLASTNADCSILNSGTLRSDRIHSAGPFSHRDLLTVLPMMDSLVVINVSGTTLVEALENGVSQYPKLEGRFPQVAGIKFAFDPSKPPGNRVDPKFVRVGDEYIQPHQFYQLATKKYLSTGHDGYTVLANCEVLKDEETCLELSIAVQNHFEAIKLVSGSSGRRNSRHHQSLVTVSRRHSLLRTMSSLQIHDLSPTRGTVDRGLSLSPRPSLSRQGNVVDDLEKETCQLAPHVEGRIVIIKNKEILHDLIKEHKEWEANRAIQEEDENGSPSTPPAILSRLRALHSRALHSEALTSSSRDSGFSNSNSRETSPPTSLSPSDPPREPVQCIV